MRRNIGDTPLISPICRALAGVFLRLTGWTTGGKAPNYPKYVVVAAPHTSNWDGLFLLCLALKLHMKINWMVKDSYFWGPFGPIMKWLGGMPIDRSGAHNVVNQVIDTFSQNEEFVVLIPPEGTRKKAEKWKRGFYHIAKGAQIPIVLSYLDYGRKIGGIGPTILPSGDIDRDMQIITDFYSGITAKYPGQYTAP